MCKEFLKRLDVLLVEKFHMTRSYGEFLIESGCVYVNGTLIKKKHEAEDLILKIVQAKKDKSIQLKKLETESINMAKIIKSEILILKNKNLFIYIMSDKVPNIQPIKLKEFDTKQSKYDMVPRLPVRSVILGPSGSGKTILLQNMILDIYRDCFSRIYIPQY